MNLLKKDVIMHEAFSETYIHGYRKMTSDEFKAFCRSGNKNYFTRIRKMPLQDLLFTMINRKGLTLALELRNYMKLAHPGVSISKPGYLKQRMKLNPDAF